MGKSFLLLFFKKEGLPSLLPLAPATDTVSILGYVVKTVISPRAGGRR
jgi:hypothetical protein